MREKKFLKVSLYLLGIAFLKAAYCTIDKLAYREDRNLYTVNYKTSLTPGNPTKIPLGPK